jgi:phage tail sheath protein FI
VTSVSSARLDSAAPSVFTREDAVAFATKGFGGTPLDKSAGDFGALYYPWIWSTDPIGPGRNPKILLPPSGFVAGIYARIDNSRGVFKAPAGIETGVAGALAVATTVSDVEQDTLNPISVNVIRTVPGSGFVVWGARTFGSDASWRYIPVRRTAIFLRVSIYYGIQWAVFEPNDESLWAELRLNIRSFMLTQFRAGAFQGSTPDDAFFVKCDSSTTTQQDIDNGVVNILVGFAPLKPAEFVVLKLSQKVNQPAS